MQTMCPLQVKGGKIHCNACTIEDEEINIVRRKDLAWSMYKYNIKEASGCNSIYLFEVIKGRWMVKRYREREPRTKHPIRSKTSGQEGAQWWALSANRFIWRVRTSPRITCYQAGIAWVNVKWIGEFKKLKVVKK